MLALSISGPTSAQCAYEVVATFSAPPCGPGFQTILQASAINNTGEVVGSYSQCAVGNDRPFYWSQKTGLIMLALPPGYFSARFSDINDEGQITGNRVVPSSGLGSEAILYEDGRWTGLGTVSIGNWSDGIAINNDGTIVGFWMNNVTGPIQAFRWDNGTMTDLGPTLGAAESKAFGISDDGIVVGYVSSGGHTSEIGFTVDGGAVTFVPPFPGTTTARVASINQSGSAMIVHGASISGGWRQSILVSGGTWQLVPPIPPGLGVTGTGVDACGTVVAYNFGNGVHEAVIFANGNVRLLQDMIKSEQRFVVPDGVMNDLGWIAASTAIGQIPVTIVLRPVPPVIGDLDADCEVGASDLAILLGNWGGAPRAAGDLDGDGDVDAQDLSILLGEWGPP